MSFYNWRCFQHLLGVLYPHWYVQLFGEHIVFDSFVLRVCVCFFFFIHLVQSCPRVLCMTHKKKTWFGWWWMYSMKFYICSGRPTHISFVMFNSNMRYVMNIKNLSKKHTIQIRLNKQCMFDDNFNIYNKNKKPYLSALILNIEQHWRSKLVINILYMMIIMFLFF